MDFDFSDEQRLLQRTARNFLGDRCPLEKNRDVLDGKRAWDPELWGAIAQLGWLGVALPERFGGAGAGYLELALLSEALGEALAPLPFAPSVLLATEALRLAGSDEQQERDLPRLVTGELIGTLAYPEGPDSERIDATFEDGRLTGRKRAVPAGMIATHAVVVARTGGSRRLAWVDLNDDSVEREGVLGIDPSRALANLAFQDTPAEGLGRPESATEHLEEILDRAAVLLAFEQLGGASRAFELTKEFMLQRYAFGRPVASFQALKHRMVDIYAALELARSNAYFGAWALSESRADLAVAAPAARVSATEAYELATVEMIQMHGGIGFTWEADCHLFYRRAKNDAVMLGTPRYWRERLIRQLESQKGSSHELR